MLVTNENKQPEDQDSSKTNQVTNNYHPHKEKEKKSWGKVIAKEGLILALMGFIIFAFKSSFFGTYVIPTGSMIPTLRIGDFILVNQYAYGFKVPFSQSFGSPIYLNAPSDPKRGEVIVFKYPLNPDIDYIKRVVAVPGDKIEVLNKKIIVNGVPIPLKEVDGKEFLSNMVDYFGKRPLRFYKAKTGEANHIVQEDQGIYNPNASDMPLMTIPKDKYFVIGDNRDHSADSRFWSFVPRENIRGRAMFVWFSMVSPFSEHEFKLRLERIGTKIL